MRKLKLILLLLLTSAALASVTGVVIPKHNAPLLTLNPKSGYPELWRKTDSLASLGLTRSVLDVVKVIYQKAKEENNAPNLVKSVIYRLKFESYISDDDYVKAIYDLTEEARIARHPVKPLMHSVLAEIYWRYYQQNRYRFLQRSQTVNFEQSDVRTWDLRKIVDKVIENYQISLENADSSKAIALNLYDEVLTTQYDSKKFRPTLYDFLAHRAIDFFMSEEPGLTRPAERFGMNDPMYFEDASKFAEENITTNDTYALKYYAIRIYQELLRFHLKDSNPEALIDVDLQRLRFVYKNAPLENADSLYLGVLRKMEQRYISHPSSCEATYEIASFWNTSASRYAPLVSQDHKWDAVRAFNIAQTAIDRFPDSYGARNCKYLQSTITAKNMSFIAEETSTPAKPSRILFSSKNMDKVFVRICKVDPQWNKRMTRKYYGDELLKQYTRLSAYKSFTIEIPDDKDYQTHSLEIPMPELPAGYYLILTGSAADFSFTNQAVAYADTWVSNLCYLKRSNADYTTTFTVLDRNTGLPVPNASVQIYREKYNYTIREYEYTRGPSLVTDADGLFTVPNAQDYNYNYCYADITAGNDRIQTDAFYQSYYNPRKEEPVLRTVFFTDRAIYRPGQTIYFKGIMLETTGDKTVIKPGYQTTVSFYDVNSQKVSEQVLTSNDYGTFSGTFTAPSGVLTGQMYISNVYGYSYFSVEEYKRPKFEVTFDPVKGSYKLGEMVTVKGIAKAYAGSSVDQAKVKYRVVRTASFPYWWYYYWGYYPQSPQIEIVNGELETDAEGRFTINFKAIPDNAVSKNSSPIFNYQVYADVTDINGETRSAQTKVRASNTALEVSVGIPEEVERSGDSDFEIVTSNLNGQREHSRGTIEVFRVNEPERIMRSRSWLRPDRYLMSKAEFEAKFPYDAYGDENELSKYPRGEKVYDLVFNTASDSVLHLREMKIWKPGRYLLEIKARDQYGTEVSSIHNFVLYGRDDKLPATRDIDWFTVIKDRCEPGETASFLIASADTANVYYEVEHKGKIIEKKWLKLNNQQLRIDLPVKEEYRGNVSVHFTFVRNGRLYKHDQVITVPYTNKQLDIAFETFRNKLLPGQQEEWKIIIKGPAGQQVAAEMLAGMYDASLDAFRANSWLLNIYNTYYAQLSWNTTAAFSNSNSQIYHYYWNTYSYYNYRYYDALNWFGFNNYYRYNYAYYDDLDYSEAVYEMDGETGVAANEAVLQTVTTRAARGAAMPAGKKESFGFMGDQTGEEVAKDKSIVNDLEDATAAGGERANNRNAGGLAGGIKTRTNFNETAFFYPHLLTNEKGEIVISFTMPEALTKWKFMGLATTKDLSVGYVEKEVVTQKDLIILTNPPRFFREGDEISFSAKVSNLSSDSICGEAELYLFDALTNQPIDIFAGNSAKSRLIDVPKGQSTEVSWDIKIPFGVQAITYKVYAKAGNFTDGEEMIIPVLTNRMLVTETMPLPIRGKSEKTFNFAKLINAGNSSTLRHQKLTLEFTSNPAWYAIQALPYMMEYPYECAEQTFSRFYANSIATHIANSHPQIKAVFDSWKNETPDALLSNLEKNQELKNAILQETPWVLQAKSESQRKRNVGLLFDILRMSDEIDKALTKLEKLQCSNGGWPWFKGMPDDRYITQHIITGMGHLDKLGVKDVKEDHKAWNSIRRGTEYLDNRIREDYEYILKYYPEHINENNLSGIQIQYLYARSYYMKRIPLAARNQKAFNYFKGQAQKYWLQNNRYLQGMIALALNRLEDPATANNIMKSLKENAMFSEEMGMYWKDMDQGYYWYQAPIETQALLIEAFDEVANDQVSVEELKVWLLKQKQTQDWKTTKATAEACFALLLRGSNWLAIEPDVSIYVGGKEVDPKKIPDVKAEAGTGYFKTSWNAGEITPDMGNVKVLKRDEGVAWGAMYWQYFEDLDKITFAETPLKLEKKLFVERNTPTGPVIEPVTSATTLKVGDKIKVRIEIRSDRDMEYVQLKDMRASGFEPINVISQYKYQDGLGYYEATGDAATNFFISYLKKGTYVFEYPLRVSHRGNFSNGITTIQCMYAPEFSAHSEGIRVTVK
jgi:uncharacterized protein YfaS (alpha-2-macroglobulin family)